MALTLSSNGTYDEIPECPLCLEPLGLDDINFYPCACRYQICRFCWHRIRTDENGLCPQCREMYSENPAEYTPPTPEQLAKLKSEKKQKELFKKQKITENREKLAAVRVIQRNLVFVIGLSPRLADPEVLKRNEYFGKYGKIYKVVINNNTIYSGAQGPSVSAYVTYCRNEDASKAIAAVNNTFIDGRSLKASFGTTKYCTSFLKGTPCTKPDCMYLHELGDDEASFTKEDMQLGKHQVFEHATLASVLGGVGGGGVVSQNNHKEILAMDNGGKVRHLTSQKSRETGMSDGAESALPASAHWAQKVHTGVSDSGTLDLTHNQSKQSSPNVAAKSGKGSTPTRTSTQSSRGTTAEHNGSMKISRRGHRPQEAYDWEDSNSNPRAESLSPSTQKIYQRNSDSIGSVGGSRRTGGGTKEREGALSGHSHNRRSSLGTKSLTPNLSPRSTLSASSSIGSLGLADSVVIDESVNNVSAGIDRVAPYAGLGVEFEVVGIREPRSVEEMFSGENWEEEVDDDISEQMGVVKIDSEVEDRTGHVDSDEVTGASVSEGSDGPTRIPVSDSVTNLYMQPVEYEGPSHCSPPGFRKSQQSLAPKPGQPMRLSQQSEMVYRRLQLETQPSALGGLVGMTSRDSSENVQEMAGAELGKSAIGNVGDSVSEMSSNTTLHTTTGVQSVTSFSGASSGSNAPASWTPHQTCSNPSLYSTSTSSKTTLSHPEASSFSTGLSQRPHTVTSAAVSTPSAMAAQLERSDDADELGFDPCMVSQQGLADLLETEAEQKQQRRQQHVHQRNVQTFPYQARDSQLQSSFGLVNNAVPASALPYKKGLPNGFRTLSGDGGGGSSQYQNWKEDLSHSRSDSSPAGPAAKPTSDMTSLKDEFRALFPSVNISFGESSNKMKTDKPSSLVQALDDAKSMSSYLTASSSSSSFSSSLSSSLSSSSTSSSSPYPHQFGIKRDPYPTSSTNSTSLDSTDYFLGQSQPGFPSTCLRVRDHNTGGSASTSNKPRTSTAGDGSVSSCLGPEWPELGMAVAQMNKSSAMPATSDKEPAGSYGQVRTFSQSRTEGTSLLSNEPSKTQSNLMSGFQGGVSGTGQSQPSSSQGLGVGVFDQVPPVLPLLYGASQNQSSSSPLSAAASTGVTASTISNLWRAPAAITVSVNTSSTTTTNCSSSLPSPPPGFSKPASLPNQGDGNGAKTGGGTGTGTSAGIGAQTQASSTGTSVASPMFVMNSKGQMVPSQQFVQAWMNSMRTLSTFTPAQLQQITRNNQVAYQQLLRQQYLFQQAMLRNPQALLQIQSLWMAQLHQQALIQQKQQQVLAAAAASMGTGLPTTNCDASTSTSGSAVSCPQTSKLLGTMSNSGMTSTSESVTVTSATSSTEFHSGSKAKDLQSDSAVKTGSKAVHQSVSSASKSVPSSSTKVSGHVASSGRGGGSTRTYTTPLANGPVGQQNSSSRNLDTRHYSKPTRNLSKGKVSGAYATASHNSSVASEKKSRQKSSK